MSVFDIFSGHLPSLYLTLGGIEWPPTVRHADCGGISHGRPHVFFVLAPIRINARPDLVARVMSAVKFPILFWKFRLFFG